MLVTGANGGLGTEFVRQALAGGAKKVYAAARSPRQWDDPRVVPLTLDVTDEAAIERAADSRVPAMGYGMACAVGNVLTAIGGTLLVVAGR